MAEPLAAAGVERLGPGERVRVGWAERFGLRPWDAAWRDARKAIAGTPGTPATVWDTSSLRIFKPRISLPTWLGRTRSDRLVPIYNFFNRNQPPRSAPYSVKVRECRDWMGGQWTYDGHVGTDFAVPVGTPVVTPAPGVVVGLLRQLDHGGLKVCIDHGGALFTTSGHLSRALVAEGERVGRGQPIGISGAAGIEFVLFFPWVAPHLHLNVWLGGEPVDPFAREGEVSLWRTRNRPAPWRGPEGDPRAEDFEPSEWDPDGVEASIEACRDAEVRERARAIGPLERRAAYVLFHRVLTSAAFDAFPPLYRAPGARRPCLDLPFRADDFDGVALPGISSGRVQRGGAP